MAAPTLEVASHPGSHAVGHVAYHSDTATEAQPRVRLLFVDHTSALGGGEIALFNLVTHLDPDHYLPSVVLFSDGPLANRFREAGIPTHVLPLAPSVIHTRKDSLGPSSLTRVKDIGRILKHVRRLAQFIREHEISLVHTNSLKADLIGGLAARLARVPVLWHVRDRIADDYLPRPVVHLFRCLCRVIPDYVIANSHATLATIGRRPRRSGVVYSGIDVREIAGSLADARGRAPRIGIVGRISPWKGQHIFLRAAALVRRRHPEARFQIIGGALFDESDYEAEINALCASLELTHCVEFAGFRSNVAEVMANLDVLAHASTTPEPFGRVVVEGMAAEKAVVATNGGGIPEIVQDGVTGLLVPMGDAAAMADAICRILEDPAAARDMGRRARARVMDNFTIEIAAREVERIYEDMLQPLSSPLRAYTRRAAESSSSV